jgi:NADPH:quinone reductase
MKPQLVRDTHDELMRLHAAGEISPLVSQVLPLEAAAEALARLAARGTWGKVVCAIDGAAPA